MLKYLDNVIHSTGRFGMRIEIDLPKCRMTLVGERQGHEHNVISSQNATT